MRLALLLSLALSFGCRTSDKVDGSAGGVTADTGSVDADGDGFTADEDCDDDDSSLNPGATEVCDGLDNNCDGEVDEGVTLTFYDDGDADGFGDADAAVEACDKPADAVASGTDCDDGDPAVYPGATELCDGLDNNCDGAADEGLTSSWYPDGDGDGFGDDDLVEERCDEPSGWVQVGRDCDDGDPAVFPGAAEVCDELDNDCDGDVDEGVTTTFWADSDGDGYGLDAAPIEACSLPLGYAEQPDDCDDGAFDVNPAATEVCNSVDDDCDGATDEDDASDAATWYADSDSDGYGDPTTSRAACAQPSGYVADNTDCDDATAGSNPAATEACNGADDDCDGTVDEDDASDASTWYRDADSDGYGTTATTDRACSQPAGYVGDNTDCDDADGAINPGATEVCNDVDDDCDGAADDGLATTTWYDDDDSDGYGDASASTDDCAQPAGAVTDATDCDDGDAAINPAATEVCDGQDNDCDGDTDDDDSSVSGGSTFYADADSDGYGDATSTTTACTQPSGYTTDDSDCDDGTATTYPGAAELCNDTDDDCDNELDEYVFGYTVSCPAESCDEILDLWAASDGTYLLDPDGSGVTSYTCDMTTDGGGWTLVVDWDRVNDGDSRADFLSHFTALRNNMSTFSEQTGRLFWQDANSAGSASADVLSVERNVPVPNAGEVLYDIEYTARSMEQSATFWWAEAGGSDVDLECWVGVQSWSNYSAGERSERPSTHASCPNGYSGSGSRDISWSGVAQDSLGAEITNFRFASFHYDSCCDYSYLYKVEAWVR